MHNCTELVRENDGNIISVIFPELFVDFFSSVDGSDCNSFSVNIGGVWICSR